MLTGVDMTSYGADLPGAPKLGRLVKTILRQVPDLPRLRLSSIDSIEADDDLLEAIADGEAADAASAPVAAVGRRHDPEAHEAPPSARRFDPLLRGRARSCGPDIVFGADIIAGFPTETEAMFDNSLSIVEECGLTHLHVFPFSPREGTPAARMPQVARARSSRSARRGCARRAKRPIAGISRRLPARGSRSWSSATGSAARKVSRWPRSMPAAPGEIVDGDDHRP